MECNPQCKNLRDKDQEMLIDMIDWNRIWRDAQGASGFAGRIRKAVGSAEKWTGRASGALRVY
jgi:hypothetical protein